MRLRLMAVLLAATALATGCSCDDDEAEGDIDPEGRNRPAAFRDLSVHMDLLELAHLADVDHRGTYIDFGTPARMKYTVGHWRTGWTSDEDAGDVTFSYVGITGRVFFQVDEPGPLTIRFRAKPVGSRNLSVFLNNNQQELVRLEEGDQFRDYDVTVPADHVERGENYMLLRFGGTEQVGGQDVAVAIESIRVFPGESIPEGEYHAPTYGSLVQEMAVGQESRQAIVVRRPTNLSWYVQVPPGGKLGFGVGAEGDDPAPARAKVFVTAEGEAARQVYSGSVGAEWQDEVADLASFAGKVVRLDFRIEGDGAGRVGWSVPAMYVAPPEEEREDVEQAENVVVLVIDTLRADKLRPYNPRSRVQTPRLSQLADDGAVFLNAQSPENWTKPSCASILTGLYPTTHTAKTSEARVPDGVLLLSEHLKANEFATGSFIANGYVSDRFGFDQGWDSYTNYIRDGGNTEAENVFREARDWIASNRDDRFFAYIQTIDPHVPYDPPPEFLSMYDANLYEGQVQPRQTPTLLERAKRNPPQVTFDARDRRRLEALYDGEISYHDHWMGWFIDQLKEMEEWDNTLFVITSDHGEEFADHGSWGHGHSVYQELLHVPLMFHMGGSVPPIRVEETVSTLDIPRTVTAATGVPMMPADEGRDLSGFMHDEAPAGPYVAFSDFLDDRRVITAGRWKLILRGINATFFDLESDPGEERELDRHDHPVAFRFCRTMLGQFLGASNRQQWLDAEQSEGARFDNDDAVMDDTIRGQLEALGYVDHDHTN